MMTISVKIFINIIIVDSYIFFSTYSESSPLNNFSFHLMVMVYLNKILLCSFSIVSSPMIHPTHIDLQLKKK